VRCDKPGVANGKLASESWTGLLFFFSCWRSYERVPGSVAVSCLGRGSVSFFLLVFWLFLLAPLCYPVFSLVMSDSFFELFSCCKTAFAKRNFFSLLPLLLIG
jgi:hypothetical protein